MLIRKLTFTNCLNALESKAWLSYNLHPNIYIQNKLFIDIYDLNMLESIRESVEKKFDDLLHISKNFFNKQKEEFNAHFR